MPSAKQLAEKIARHPNQKSFDAGSFTRRNWPWLYNKTRVVLYAWRLAFHPRSLLRTQGYWQSLHTGSIVNRQGEKLPWVNYALIHFLQERLQKDMTVFEYGAGFSTEFFAKRCAHVTSVEYNPEWVEIIKPQLPKNTEVLFRSMADKAAYVGTVQEDKRRKYDVVLVDGRERVKCVEAALSNLSKRGVVILDNSERPHYRKAHKIMAKEGFKHLHFIGLAPWGIACEQSTVYYRDGNGLDI